MNKLDEQMRAGPRPSAFLGTSTLWCLGNILAMCPLQDSNPQVHFTFNDTKGFQGRNTSRVVTDPQTTATARVVQPTLDFQYLATKSLEDIKLRRSPVAKASIVQDSKNPTPNVR
ncbi:hypothetical protein B0H13DRAFT_1860280 [Mycena leptocephala]|nr:hypothetical protein B0H13DRAFT_1860280 [Mycena leptocephala]